MSKPLIAIVGRPNVGKSTLFNKLTGQRLSIVEDTPGVTRDRIYAPGEWCGREFMLVDTGGIEPKADDVLLSKMRMQAQIAIDAADVIIFVVDLKSGVTANDADIAHMLQKCGKPVVLCVNKCDSLGDVPPDFYEFYNLGLGDPYPVSSVHGHGTGDLLDACIEKIDWENRTDYPEEYTKVAVIGKPNVGKSSLLNALLGEERAIVTAIPGTTRDVLDEQTAFGGVPVRLVDTAGIRETGDEAERIGVQRARKALEEADVVLLVLDGTGPLTEEDAGLLRLTAEKRRILVRSKGDLPPCKNVFGDISVSAWTGAGLPELKQRVLALAGPGEHQGCITNERHIHALEQAEKALASALAAPEEDCAATDIREALHCLGAITGRDADEAVIDAIFSRFCVGK